MLPDDTYQLFRPVPPNVNQCILAKSHNVLGPGPGFVRLVAIYLISAAG